MPDFLYWFGGIIGYGFMAGIGFHTIAITSADPDDPWETPGPFFGGLLWPLMLPAMLGMGIVKVIATPREDKNKKRRMQEIAEAEHKKKLAQLHAEELAINERALNMTESG